MTTVLDEIAAIRRILTALHDAGWSPVAVKAEGAGGRVASVPEAIRLAENLDSMWIRVVHRTTEQVSSVRFDRGNGPDDVVGDYTVRDPAFVDVMQSIGSAL
jgi:hypothetical protein